MHSKMQNEMQKKLLQEQQQHKSKQWMKKRGKNDNEIQIKIKVKAFNVIKENKYLYVGCIISTDSWYGIRYGLLQ